MKHITLPKLQSGISIVEIMIAMLIGVFLTGGLIQMFITSKNTNKLQDAVSRVQENGRFAMEFITQDVRQADYFMECSTANKDANAIMGTDNDTTDPALIDGTDTITLRQTIGSCDQRQLIATTYSIRAGANGQPALYRTTQTTPTGGATTTTTQELVEGVENMQILYGVDTDPITDTAEYSIPNYYVAANAVVNTAVGWDDVAAIQISLLVKTVEDNIVADPLPYTYNGVTTTPTDKRIRRVYNSTITLRNRVN